jgi:PncC family amidohydrolase
MVAPVLADLPGLELGYCARPGEVEVRVVGVHAAEAERRVRAALGEHVFGTGDERLEEVVVRELTLAGKTVATAESCTGGLIAHRLTNVSGSSAVFLAGWVTYSNAAKMRDLGVREETLRQHGAVSEAVAGEMAEGARQRSGADYAVSATGIAGPTGGTPEKPVGLVYIGLATPTGTQVQRHVVGFERETFKWFVSQTALDLLRRALVENGGAVSHRALPESLVGRAGPSAPPRRNLVSPDVPLGVRADEAVFFVTICTQPRGVNQLCQPGLAERVLESVAYRHQRGDWWAHYVLLMPDHCHALLSFPGNQTLEAVVREWKKYVARELGIQWQRDFFEHRLRGDESLRDKQEYIRQNPVRAGLVSRPEDWTFVWEPPETDGGAVGHRALPENRKTVGRAGPSASSENDLRP